MHEAIPARRNLTIYLTGVFISGLGSKLTIIALADKLFLLSGNGSSVTLMYLTQGIPALLIGLLAGHVIDRSRKKEAFFLINLSMAVFSLTLACVSRLPLLFLIILLSGVADAFYSPATTALIPLLVRGDELASANGLKSSVIGFDMILGYAFAGLFVNFFGHTLSFLADSASYLVIAFSTLLLNVRNPGTVHAEKHRVSFKEALVFMKNHKLIQQLMAIDVLTQFIIAMQIPLTFLFVAEYLGGHQSMAGRTGILFSAAGVGMALGGLIVKRFGKQDKLSLLSRGLICDSLFVIAFSLNHYFPATLFIYGAMGVIGAFMGSLLETAVQEQTPGHLIGSVSGLIHSISDPVSVFSLLIGSAVVQFIDVQWIFLACAAAELLTGIFFTVRRVK